MTTEHLLYIFAIGYFVLAIALLIMHDVKDDEIDRANRRANYFADEYRKQTERLEKEKAKNNRTELVKGLMKNYPQPDEPNNVIGFEANMKG